LPLIGVLGWRMACIDGAQVPKQGAGAIDVYAAITTKQRVTPAALPLGELHAEQPAGATAVEALAESRPQPRCPQYPYFEKLYSDRVLWCMWFATVLSLHAVLSCQ
jgi:hypothetical protein